MIYCAKCGLPPEYCEWAPRGVNYEECKQWLNEAHPKLYSSIHES